MIYLIPSDSDVVQSGKVFSVSPDKPKQESSIRKLIFFMVHEGLFLSFNKVVARLTKQNVHDSLVFGLRGGDVNGVSYDGGDNYYVSDLPKDDWLNPFSYDVLEGVSESVIAKDSLNNSLFMIGMGNYAQSYSKAFFSEFKKRVAIDYSSITRSKYASDFDFTSHDFRQSISFWRLDTNPVAIVSTFHSDHANQTAALIESNSKGFVFVEKPPLVKMSEIEIYRQLYKSEANIEIGFNRRYAPAISRMKKLLTPSSSSVINISVNEVSISDTHWYFWGNQGTRITGNACHWIDLCQYFVESKPIKLFLSHSTTSLDDCNLAIVYSNGSIANIQLTDKGNDLRGVQERIEVRQDNKTLFLDDFLIFTSDIRSKRRTKRYLLRDKGHKHMYKYFVNNVTSGEFKTRYPFEDLRLVCHVTCCFAEMLQNGESSRSLEL